MYKFIRQIHLVAGLSLLLFIVMYFISGYVIIHGNWFGNPEPTQTTRTESLAYAGENGPEAWSQYLRQKFGLAGQPQPGQRLNDGRWRYRYFKPGIQYTAIVAEDQQSVQIVMDQYRWQRTMVGFHILHGYHGGWLYVLWAIVYDLASASMIVFALTGIYMWYKLTRRRLLGWILLVTSYVVATGMVLYLMYMP